MDKRIKINEDDVIMAGIALRKAGEPINGWALRRKLGGGRSDRLLKIWNASPEGRLETTRPPRSQLAPALIEGAVSAVTAAALAAVKEIDAAVSKAFMDQEYRHGIALSEATQFAESVEAGLESQLAEMAGRERESLEQAARAEAEAAAIPALRQEIADLREMVRLAQAAEATARAELAAAQSSRDDLAARLAAAEDRERAALERAARAEAMAAVTGKKG